MKERLQSRNFYYHINIQSAEVEKIGENSKINSFRAGLVEDNEEVTILLGARLSQFCSSAYNKNGHNLLKQDLITYFRNSLE